MFHSLEPRRLFSASAGLKGGALLVDGTDGNDVVSIVQKQIAVDPQDVEHLFVTVNGQMIGEFHRSRRVVIPKRAK